MISKLIAAIVIVFGLTNSALCKSSGFVITSVVSSTSANQQTNEPIEPAFGDYVTYHWQNADSGKFPRAIALYKEFKKPASNRIKAGKGSSFRYYEKIANSETVLSGPESKTGVCYWPSKDGSVYWKTFPAGRHRVGLIYAGTKAVELTDFYVDVQLTVYDVATSGTLYIGDNSARVEYYLSSEAVGPKNNRSKKPNLVKINMAKDSFVFGPGKAGKNLSAPWNGTTSKGEYIDGGATAISFNLVPVADNPVPKRPVGANLKISNLKCLCDATKKNTFIPELGQQLKVSFNLVEPVARPHAKSAQVTVFIYDEDGRFVRLLKNSDSEIDGVPVKINNLAEGHSDGKNVIIWDGRDERGDIVDTGRYQITVFAEDNCGVGCESNSVSTNTVVDFAPITETAINWPEEICELPKGWKTLPKGVPGYTDSDGPVYASVDNSPEAQARFEKDFGMFFVDIVQTPGLHNVKLRTKSTKFPEKTINVPYFINDYSIASPKADERFGCGSEVPIVLSSKCADVVDVSVSDPFDLSALYDPDNPVPAADKLNSLTTAKKIRSLSGPDGLAVAAGSTTIKWDGKDDAGVFVKPGVYNIVITRRNTDNLLDIDAEVSVVIADANGPKIGNVKEEIVGSMISLSWTTDVPSNCYVISGSEYAPCRKLRAHTVGNDNNLAIHNAPYGDGTTYRIIAESKADGAVSISQKKQCLESNSIHVEMQRPFVSGTGAELKVFLLDKAFVALEYGRIDGDLDGINWTRIEQKKLKEEHVFKLTGLKPNSEYAYRAICSTKADWSQSTVSDFESFVTKKSVPSVAFVGIKDGQGFETLDHVKVKASGSHPRFSKHGITKIELMLEGDPVRTYTKQTVGNSVIYDFDLSTLKKHIGVNDLTAVATDDYWLTSSATMQVLLHGKASKTDEKTGN